MSDILYRKAKMADVPAIHKLINFNAEKGLMLAKSLVTIYENLREYTIAEYDGQLVGVAGLHIMWSDLAEVRSLAIAEDFLGRHIGAKLVAILEEESRDLGIGDIFALTYQTEFFVKQGYVEIEHKDLPQKVWMECINCPKFPDCDEHAVLKKISLI